ncbi:MAG: protein translocase subunit SecF [Spirochaetales bacterium]|nr:protein translocase subunit SecF [Spirochaetales bacterium]
MRKVIKFTKYRFIMITISLVVIISGYAGLILRGGFNLGIDFKGGLTEQIQIAPVAFTMSYTGKGKGQVIIAKGETIGQGGGRLELTVTENGDKKKYIFSFTEYTTLKTLTDAVKKPGNIKIDIKSSPELPTADIISLDHNVDITGKEVVINRILADGETPFANISEMRNVLTTLGKYSLQLVKSPQDQEFIIRVETNDNDKQFRQNTENKIYELLSAKYGSEQVIVKKTDFVGPRFSKDLAKQTISLTVVALALILIYISFRFKLIYAVAAILALVHDVSVMLGVIGTFQLEVTTATIAAVLTIIGYSLNDTIVIFDRIRENVSLLRDEELASIIDTSITQSLSRTLMTSLTTLLAVAAIYFFGTGSIKQFAFNLIVGIFVGTYSSIFIASPVVLEWQNMVLKRRRRLDATKYGVKNNVIPLSRGKGAVKGKGEAAVVSAASKAGRKEAPAGGNKDKVIEMPVITERKLRRKKKKKKKK